ncbi:hypothetical protein, partial [Pseudomonas aeruginosa]|uniref:hypothetical protein n=1 Tax=Pseudomonas aeruginosa TaxID=287 RepID=UPI003523A1CA
CFMGKLGEVKSGDFAKSGSLFQTFPSFSRPVLASPPKPLMVPIQRMRDAGFQKACVGFWIGKRCCRAYGVALCGRR